MEFSYTAGGIKNYQQLNWLHYYVVKLKISTAYNQQFPFNLELSKRYKNCYCNIAYNEEPGKKSKTQVKKYIVV